MSAKDLDKAYEEELEAARERGAVIEFPPARERRGLQLFLVCLIQIFCAHNRLDTSAHSSHWLGGM